VISSQTPQAAAAQDQKVHEVEAALRRWETKFPNAAASIAAVRQLLLLVAGLGAQH
jgi:hypothetical protein